MKMPKMDGHDTNNTEVLQWAYVPGNVGIVKISRQRSLEDQPWQYEWLWSLFHSVHCSFAASSLTAVIKDCLDYVAKLDPPTILEPLADPLCYPFRTKASEATNIAAARDEQSIQAWQIPVGTHLGNEPTICYFFRELLGKDTIDGKGYLTRNELPWYSREDRAPSVGGEQNRKCLLRLIKLEKDGRADGIITIVRGEHHSSPTGCYYYVSHSNDFCYNYKVGEFEFTLLPAVMRAVSYAGDWNRLRELPDLGDYPVYYRYEPRGNQIVISLSVRDDQYSPDRTMLAREVPAGAWLTYDAPFFFQHWLGIDAVKDGTLVRTG